MICAKCLGPLYADRESVAEAATRGYRGGRIYCRSGCTDLWLLARADGSPDRIVAPRYTHYERADLEMACHSCGRPFLTRASNAKRCQACREEMHRVRARESQRRHVERLEEAVI